MALSSALNEDIVFPLITELVVAGEYPTSRQLRDRLGGRGSPVVLQRLIGAWYREHGPAFGGSPSGPAAGVRSQFDALMRDALARLDREQAERDGALDARSAALDERERALQAREAALGPLLDELRALHRGAMARRDAAVIEAAEARAQRALVEGRVQRLEADLHKAVALRAEADYARQALEREQGRVVELVGKRDELERALKRQTDESADLRGKLEELRERFTAKSIELARARERLEQLGAGR